MGMAIVTAGCGQPGTESWVSGASYPTSIAYHQAGGRLFVGSYDDGSVGEITLTGGAYRVFLPPGENGRRNALRIKLDAARDRLWVLGRRGVYLYDVPTRRLIHHAVLPDWTFAFHNCLPDMALDASGAALVTSNLEPALWRIDSGTFEVTRHEIDLGGDRGKDFGFNGLAYGGATLFAASAVTGTLWRIDLERRMARKVELSLRLRGACGLTPGAGYRPRTLFVAGGFKNGLLRVHLSEDLERGYVTSISMGGAADTPTGMAFAGALLLLSSSQLSRHPDYFGDARALSPFRIIPIHLP